VTFGLQPIDHRFSEVLNSPPKPISGFGGVHFLILSPLLSVRSMNVLIRFGITEPLAAQPTWRRFTAVVLLALRGIFPYHVHPPPHPFSPLNTSAKRWAD